MPGMIDTDGFLHLTDRRSYTIITEGVNIYPQDTEDVLTTILITYCSWTRSPQMSGKPSAIYTRAIDDLAHQSPVNVKRPWAITRPDCGPPF
jgi:acyl-CoA synthetase (AMP-forming)/AMP-acid ligase II